MKIIFATNNKHKVAEIRQAVGNQHEILSLADINFSEEIPETQSTIEGNASQKSHFIHDRFQVNCFSDDTGLEIEALNGEPGVYSARYAGKDANFQNNIDKVLTKLAGIENRKAKFRTIISLIINGEEHQFEGICEGEIITEERGEKGFGYDPIFKPKGYEQTFAEMNHELKNKISHRGLAVEKLVEFLKNQNF